MHFFPLVLQRLQDVMRPTDSVLAVCAGSPDAQFLHDSGFTNVTISNLDDSCEIGIQGFKWCHQDAESLTFEDGSFDWCIVHAGLHHCSSPHRALIEMCRVARKGAIVMESRDSVMVRAAAKLGFTFDYEFDAVALNDYAGGGCRNGPVPNYIYRWTEREVRKTLESAFPYRTNNLRFFYDLVLPTERLATLNSPLKYTAPLALGLARLFNVVLPKQCNRFGFAVLIGDSKPWIENVNGHRLKRDFKLSFDPAKYR